MSEEWVVGAEVVREDFYGRLVEPVLRVAKIYKTDHIILENGSDRYRPSGDRASTWSRTGSYRSSNKIVLLNEKNRAQFEIDLRQTDAELKLGRLADLLKRSYRGEEWIVGLLPQIEALTEEIKRATGK